MGWLETWTGKADRAAVSDDFRKTLTREILKTELIRIKALIVSGDLDRRVEEHVGSLA